MKVLISLAQMHLNFGQPAINFERASEMIQQAAQDRVECILFPELWTSGYDFENRFLHARYNLLVLEKLAELAQVYQIAIGGSYLEGHEGNLLFNTQIW